MENRIDARFKELKTKGRAGLVTFITSGYPDHDACQEIMNGLPEAGADLIELGMPFSDPMADGPAIQVAGTHALANGANMKKTLEIVSGFRKADDATPVILMGYFNPVMAFGVARFMDEASKAGVDGLILVDLPPEEDEKARSAAIEKGLHIIRLAAPTTDDERFPVLLKDAGGFLYFVSITGVTGTASADSTSVKEHLDRVRKHTDLPVAVGFGIKTPRDATEIGSFADAVVVGSAITKTIADNMDSPDMKDKVLRQVGELRQALGE